MNPFKKILSSSKPRGLKIILFSLLVFTIMCAPLLLYILFGPSDGNPIGLGLLAVLGQLIGIVGSGIGVLLLVWDKLKG